ncbi:MAG: hypothetical protein H0U76_11645 [Ktedonobacteraceae bacterium]|nr:hypothetical protein [Ktedonobacteraceae bacterium]MBA3826304.1 hypothetical protein [Ktedonobacterales bacterium]
MPSSYQCRKSANLSRIAQMVYGSVPARVQSEPAYLVVPTAPARPRKDRKGQAKGKERLAGKWWQHGD